MSAISPADVSRPGVSAGSRPRGGAVTAVAVIAALLLVTAAVLKVLEWMQLSELAAGARATMGSDAKGPSALALGLPVLEIVIAVGIVVFRRHAWLWGLAAALFGTFAGYTFLLMARGEASCGCFGAVSTPPWVMFCVDTVMAFLCARLATRDWGFRGYQGVVLTLAGAGSIVGATYAGSSTDGPVDDSINPVATLLTLDALAGARSSARNAPQYLVYVYRETCPICQQHYPGYKAFADATAEDPTMRALLLEVHDIEKMATDEGIELPAYAWEMTPTTLRIGAGRIIESFGPYETPDPKDVYERATGRSYDAVLSALRSETTSEPVRPSGGTLGGTIDLDKLADRLSVVRNRNGTKRFADIFDDAPGGMHHLMYAHTNCGVCIEYRKQMLELQELGMLSENLKLHLVLIELLVDDGVPLDLWGGVHAALLFDGGKIVRAYGEGEVSGDLPVYVEEEIE